MKKAIQLCCLVLCWWLPLAAALHAQEAIVVDNDQATLAFPDTMTFMLTAASTADITQVTLIYGTNGRSCQPSGSRQPIDLDPAAEISAEWEWELKRSGALPPGARIWWQWEIVDAAGQTLTTARQELTVTDDAHPWRSASRNGVTVHWYVGTPAFGEAMLTEADQALARLAAEAGVPRPAQIDLWIYPSAAEVREAVLNVPEWTGGVAFPSYDTTVIGVSPGQDAWAAQVIPHELSHLVIGIRLFNCRGISLPTWLSEGLARFAEGGADAAAVAQVETALAGGSLPPLRSLAAGFSAFGGSAGRAYTQSYLAVAWLIDTHGPAQLDALLGTMQAGRRADDALQAVYGFDTNGLDARWRASVGFPATPTSAAAAQAADATPTLVPTIALIAPPVAATATPTTAPTASTTATIAVEPTPTITPSPITPSPHTPSPDTPTPHTPTPPPTRLPWAAGVALLGVGLFIIIIRRGKTG